MIEEADLIRQILHAAEELVLSEYNEFHNVVGAEEEEDKFSVTLNELFVYLCNRSRAVLHLVGCGFDWDAEIILRTCYECSSKILFICYAELEERNSLVEEFWTALGKSAERKRARKADFAKEIVPEHDQDSRDVFQLLLDPRMVRNTLNLTKSERRHLEQKWSFSEIIEALNHKVPGFRAFLHIYGMSSHLAHSDCMALDLIRDRSLRQEIELRALELSHAARIISDAIELIHICAYKICQSRGKTYDVSSNLTRDKDKIYALAKQFQEQFYVGQRDFYDEMFGRKSPEQS